MVDIQLNDMHLLADLERHCNSNRRVADTTSEETTPLLELFPLRNDIHCVYIRWLVSFLILALFSVLIAGVAIGIYLLVITDNSENTLTPISNQLASANITQRILRAVEDSNMEPRNIVIIVQADIDQCGDPSNDTKLLDTIQAGEVELPYNFLVSSSGQIIEALGWEKNSLLFPYCTENYVVLAFIGDFSQEGPTDIQVLEVTTFFEYAIRDEHLSPDYTIIGKKIKEFPKHLFLELSKLPQWSEKLSDVK